MSNILIAISTAILISAAPSSGDVGMDINTLEPIGTNVLVANAMHNTTIGASTGVAHGQSFIATDTFCLTAITLVKGKSQSYNSGNTLRLNIFAWNPSTGANDVASWSRGDGTSDGDSLDGTGMCFLVSSRL